MKEWTRDEWGNIYTNPPTNRSTRKILVADLHRTRQTHHVKPHNKVSNGTGFAMRTSKNVLLQNILIVRKIVIIRGLSNACTRGRVSLTNIIK